LNEFNSEEKEIGTALCSVPSLKVYLCQIEKTEEGSWNFERQERWDDEPVETIYKILVAVNAKSKKVSSSMEDAKIDESELFPQENVESGWDEEGHEVEEVAEENERFTDTFRRTALVFLPR